MKRGIGLALFSVLSVACLFAYTFRVQHSPGEVGRARVREKAEAAASPEQTIEDSLHSGFEEANATSAEPTQRRLAVRAKAKHPSAAPTRQASSEGMTVATGASGSGGGELPLAPTRGACAPDSFTVQPCSFDEWTYTFPQD
ncbi:MAG TPA: hypothetical protein VF754_02815 [Pyrinomonadaceae bacterium]